jgi:mannose-6-phosphate isomerase class I
VWDWNRKARELHLDRAMDVLVFDPAPMPPERSGSLDDPQGHYGADVRRMIPGDMRAVRTAGTYCVVTVFEGRATLSPNGLIVEAGHSAFVPAEAGEITVTAGPAGAGVVVSRPTSPAS